MAGAESEAGEGEGEGPEAVDASSPRRGSPEPADWRLPLSFTSPRHTEAIEAPPATDHTWRIKEKVPSSLLLFSTYYSTLQSASFLIQPFRFSTKRIASLWLCV